MILLRTLPERAVQSGSPAPLVARKRRDKPARLITRSMSDGS